MGGVQRQLPGHPAPSSRLRELLFGLVHGSSGQSIRPTPRHRNAHASDRSKMQDRGGKAAPQARRRTTTETNGSRQPASEIQRHLNSSWLVPKGSRAGQQSDVAKFGSDSVWSGARGESGTLSAMQAVQYAASAA